MVTKKTYIIGALILAVLTTIISVTLPDNVKVDVTKTGTNFYVWENGWVLGGVEKVGIVGKTGKVSLNSFVNGNNITIVRTTNYSLTNQQITEKYSFNGDLKDVETVPLSHFINCTNCAGETLRVTYSKLSYNGISRDAVSSEKFGHNIVIEWDKADKQKISKTLTGTKLTIEYKVLNNVFGVYSRIYDPAAPSGVIKNETYNVTSAYNNANKTLWATNLQAVVYNDASQSLTVKFNTTNATVCYIGKTVLNFTQLVAYGTSCDTANTFTHTCTLAQELVNNTALNISIGCAVKPAENFNLTTNLTAYWTFDDTETLKTPDNIVIDKLGIYNGSLAVDSNNTGLINQSYYWNGSNGKVVIIKNNTAMAVNGSVYSISMWFNSTVAFTTGDANLFFRWSNGSTADFDWYCETGVFGNDLIFCYAPNSGNCSVTYTNTAMDTGWHHLVSVLAPNNFKLYIDGVLAATDTECYYTNSKAADYSLNIGNNKGATESWAGWIDEVGLWVDRILTQEDVLLLNNSGSGLSYNSFTETSTVVYTVFSNESDSGPLGVYDYLTFKNSITYCVNNSNFTFRPDISTATILFNTTGNKTIIRVTSYNNSMINQTDYCYINISGANIINSKNVTMTVNESFPDISMACGLDKANATKVLSSSTSIFKININETAALKCWANYVNASTNRKFSVIISEVDI